MAKIIISRNEQVLQEVALELECTYIGRHPENHVVIAHRAVSARHASITVVGHERFIEDLGSTNGTFVNGQRIARRLLEDGDSIVIAKFQVDYLATEEVAPAAAAAEAVIGRILVSGGPNAGKTLTLTKPVSTMGKPGVQVAAISRQGGAYFISHTDGPTAPLLNGQPTSATPTRLVNGDRIDLAGTPMQFLLAPAESARTT